jgi:uncharacterized protein (DUF2235 family)
VRETPLTLLGKWWTELRGLAFGNGFSDNIGDAYSFLMQEFTPEARIVRDQGWRAA